MIAAALLLVVGSPAGSLGTDAFLAAESLPAVRVRRVPGDAAARLWSVLPGRPIAAVPQRTVALNDAAANRGLAGAAPSRTVTVRAAYDDRSLGVMLEWEDATESRAGDVDQFGDSAAIEVPLAFGAGVRLPYVGMGDAGHPVALYLARAERAGISGRVLRAAGFGSSARIEAPLSVSMRWTAKRWQALFVRPLDGQAPGLIPFAIAVWDGAQNERAGNKALSAWKFLRPSDRPIDAQYAAELSFGYAPGELGDASRGKPLVESMCAVCHHLGDLRAAPKGMAPDLSNIGAISTPRYLLDAIVAPDEPVVPHLRAARAALKTMPSFEIMSKEEVADMVAYLLTLGRPQ